MSIGRKVLSLGKRKADDTFDTEISVPVGMFDVQLPGRQFMVHHKVAEVGQVSLTTEFLLRLLHSVDGMTEEEVAQFFGFDANEMAYVVDDPESKGFISRADGRLWLTDAGHGLFKEDSEKPQIHEVLKKYERVGFDLLALAPCEKEGLSAFERALPELPIRNPDLAAHASKYVPESFRRFYGEIASRRNRDAADSLKRLSLYSVDEVIAGDRYSALVPFMAETNIRKPGDAEPVLDGWRAGHELSDRDEVVHAVGAFLDNLKIARSREADNAYELLADFAPEYMKDYVTRGGISVLRFFKETARRSGELRSDRRTIGIIGSLYLPENSRRISAAINYAAAPAHGDDDAYIWMYPSQSAWGASRALVSLMEKLSYEGVPQIAKNERRERAQVLVGCGKPEWHLIKQAKKIYDRPNNGAIPSALEVLLIPQRVAAVTVHSSILETRGYPVPLGILSFDASVVRRVHQYLQTQLPKRLNVYNGQGSCDIHSRLSWPAEIEQPVSSEDADGLGGPAGGLGE